MPEAPQDRAPDRAEPTTARRSPRVVARQAPRIALVLGGGGLGAVLGAVLGGLWHRVSSRHAGACTLRSRSRGDATIHTC